MTHSCLFLPSEKIRLTGGFFSDSGRKSCYAGTGKPGGTSERIRCNKPPIYSGILTPILLPYHSHKNPFKYGNGMWSLREGGPTIDSPWTNPQLSFPGFFQGSLNGAPSWGDPNLMLKCMVIFTGIYKQQIHKSTNKHLQGFSCVVRDERDHSWATPWKMNGWNLQITHLERKMIFQTSMIMVHVNLPGELTSEILVHSFGLVNLSLHQRPFLWWAKSLEISPLRKPHFFKNNRKTWEKNLWIPHNKSDGGLWLQVCVVWLRLWIEISYFSFQQQRSGRQFPLSWSLIFGFCDWLPCRFLILLCFFCRQSYFGQRNRWKNLRLLFHQTSRNFAGQMWSSWKHRTKRRFLCVMWKHNVGGLAEFQESRTRRLSEIFLDQIHDRNEKKWKGAEIYMKEKCTQTFFLGGGVPRTCTSSWVFGVMVEISLSFFWSFEFPVLPAETSATSPTHSKKGVILGPIFPWENDLAIIQLRNVYIRRNFGGQHKKLRPESQHRDSMGFLSTPPLTILYSHGNAEDPAAAMGWGGIGWSWGVFHSVGPTTRGPSCGGNWKECWGMVEKLDVHGGLFQKENYGAKWNMRCCSTENAWWKVSDQCWFPTIFHSWTYGPS